MPAATPHRSGHASLTDMRCFVAAYEERSFTAAARRENATQSGISQHIAKLERTLGVPLFTREKGGIVPTPPADAYYQRCLDVLRACAAAQATATALGAGLAGEISVGLMPTMTRSALAPALARFTECHPNVSVKVVEAYSGALTREVRAGSFDFAIVPAFAGGSGLTVKPFLRTPETLVSSRRLGPARHHRNLSAIDLRELAALKVVLPGPENTRRQTLATYFATHRVDVARTMELDAMMGTLDTVAGSDWVTILPGVMLAAGHDTDRFQVNPLANPNLMLDLVSIEPSRRALSAAAAAFFDILAEETRRVNAMWAHEPRRGAAKAAR